MRVSPYRQSHSRPTAKNSENLRKGLPNQELRLIIVRKNLAPFALPSAQWEKVDRQNAIMRNEIKGSEE